MRLDPLWLFLVAPLGSSVAASLGHGLQAALDQQFHGHREQGPLFVAAPPAQEDESPGGTIYKVLSNDLKFSRVTKALNFVEDVASLLDDSSAHLTFFAPPDKALRRPDHPHKTPPGAPRGPSEPPHDPHKKHFNSSLTSKSYIIEDIMATGNIDEVNYISEFRNLADALDLLDEFEESFTGSEDDEKRKKIIKIILRAVLHYHIIPTEGYDIADLNHNTTYPTKLAIPGASDGQPLRLRVSRSIVPPFTAINFFVKVLHPNIKADNGVIHVVNHPLLPPPSVFQELYLVPRHFSILTSSLQRSELTKDLDLRYIRGKGLTGSSLVTVFAPTNRAFEVLPQRLQLFLFSPFGERVLKKLLQYHVAPDVVVHSNYVHHAHAHETSDLSIAPSDESHDNGYINNLGTLFEIEELKWPVLSWIMRFMPTSLARRGHGSRKPHVEPVFSANITLETLFTNHTLHTHISQHKINFPFPGPKKPSIIDTKIFVNHHPVFVADVPSLNGVIHVVDRLLDPRRRKGKGHHHHHHHHHHPTFIQIAKTDERKIHHPDGLDSRSDRHHHKHDKHHHHHHHKADAHTERFDEVWSDWESWLVQWADEQD